ncbi:7,8-didemethyl-8-hydroxy-5-deazariboflavin synthase subunit CofG [Nitrosopumilus sp. b1]|uniref:7,8-didemethyl-8-hydroxy-5-deazariboflavin synthase subunit CofG n=1 Tax=Nitrosopumilus sp. b1 TaxID=2109907 RepID=UPI001CEBB447|nr:7,8-didemethyl-8-hydroxy-5-deazariboflavin synthase subunit CofG [Nitrosopumilus sp. b1]KAF6242551.1 7,8-didemethyl-8-hydroxy-5-deazariboflavin synthase subunit CofG [Nitrosopumilus sp. b1]
MSNLVLESESLNKILEGKNVPIEDYFQIFDASQKDGTELFKVAEKLRRKNKGNIVTFSKKAFFNIINLCKDTCSYCTYKAEPGEDKVSLMSKQNISELLQLSRKYKCVEALFVTGEKPEQKYPEARKWLKENGFSSTVEFLIDSSERALKEGLFPHTNAGNLTKDEMRELKKTNVSMGVMLENISERLSKKGMPHYLASSKNPKARLEVLKNSGQLSIPMTTGILVGIGETPHEIIDSLLAIKQLNEKFGNIQEVILQNFQPKPDTIMKDFPSTDENYFKTVVAMTRLMMPNMNIQIPPNLSPKSYQSFLSIGINDWGGISPLTPDFVNPEFTWPEINKVEKNSNDAGYDLKCRFPVYPEFMTMINTELKERMDSISDEGLVMESYWR